MKISESITAQSQKGMHAYFGICTIYQKAGKIILANRED